MLDETQKNRIIKDIETDDTYILSVCDKLISLLKIIIDPDKNAYICMSRDDATILGLFVKQFKYLQDLVASYRSENTHLFFLVQRIRYETIIKMTYLIKYPSARREYRLKSYKNRYKIYKEKTDDPVYKVMISKFLDDIVSDDFSTGDFEQIKDWRLGSKSFDKIVADVDYAENYKLAYGIPSDMIHSDWGEIRQLYLKQTEDGKVMFHDLGERKLHYRGLLYELDLSCNAAYSFINWVEDSEEFRYNKFIKTNIREIHEIVSIILEHVLNIFRTSPETYMSI